MKKPIVMLLDNGSRRPESTLGLRRLAARLSERSGRTVHPVSLQHAHKVDPVLLDGVAADTFTAFLQRQLERGERSFIVLPLFFGRSRALTRFIPEEVAAVSEHFGAIDLQLAEELCPLPRGEPRLARILCDHLHTMARSVAEPLRHVILVDHGSPLPEVTAVRQTLARQMASCLGAEVRISQAVMERRPGPEYAFNGPLLYDALRSRASESPDQWVFISQLFLGPGRHAGKGGDIETICARVRAEFPALNIVSTPLVGEHPALLEILHDRLQALVPETAA